MEQVTCLARCTQWPPIWTYTNIKQSQSCLFRTKYNNWTGRTDLCFLAWKGLSPTLVQWVYHTPTSVWLFVLLVVHYSLQQTHLDGTIVLCTQKIELIKMCDQNTIQVEEEFKPCLLQWPAANHGFHCKSNPHPNILKQCYKESTVKAKILATETYTCILIMSKTLLIAHGRKAKMTHSAESDWLKMMSKHIHMD